MTFGIFIDVAAGVLAVMIIFSLAASAIGEMVSEYVLRLRCAILTKGIRNLLGASHFDAAAVAFKTANGPGVPAGRDAVLDWSVEEFFADKQIDALMDGTRKPSAITPERYALAVQALIGAANAPDRAALAAEFAEAMDRASGWYARRMKLVLFAVGLTLAAGANIDLFGYANRLITEEQVRERAAAYLTLEVRPTPVGVSAEIPADLIAAEISGMVTALDALDMRLGWRCVPSSEAGRTVIEPGAWVCGAGTGLALPPLSRVIGWLLMAAGVTQGAEFWFGLFRKLIGWRTSGRLRAA